MLVHSSTPALLSCQFFSAGGILPKSWMVSCCSAGAGTTCTWRCIVFAYAGKRLSGSMSMPCRIPQECPLEVELLMDACLEETPSARPNIKEVINRLRAMVQSHS